MTRAGVRRKNRLMNNNSTDFCVEYLAAITGMLAWQVAAILKELSIDVDLETGKINGAQLGAFLQKCATQTPKSISAERKQQQLETRQQIQSEIEEAGFEPYDAPDSLGPVLKFMDTESQFITLFVKTYISTSLNRNSQVSFRLNNLSNMDIDWIVIVAAPFEAVFLFTREELLEMAGQKSSLNYTVKKNYDKKYLFQKRIKGLAKEHRASVRNRFKNDK